MIESSLTKLAVAVGGLALSVAAGAGVASAQPDLGPAVNTTCTYPQLEAALNAQGPAAAAVFRKTPILQAGLRQFIAAGPEKRQQMAAEFSSAPGVAPYLPAISGAFNTCNSF
jgi:hemophore-related protein